MNLRRRILTLLVAAALSVSVAACGNSDINQTHPTATPAPTPETTPSEKAFLPTKEYVRGIGRTMEKGNTLWLVHSGTGCEFTFTGTKATVKIKPDSSFMTRSNQA